MKKNLPQLNLKYPWLKSQDSHFVRCCLCRGKNKTADRFIFSINAETYRIRHCVADDLLFLFPQPGPEYLDSLYNHPSYFKGTDDMYGLTVSDEKSTAIAKIRVEEILKYKKNPESILEVGCAYGHTLIAAKEKGFKTTDGVEFSKEAIKICQKKGLKVVFSPPQGSFTNSLRKSRYDVIAMYSLLEHVQNPSSFIKKIKPLLAQDGIFVIRIPKMSAQGPWLSLVDHTWHFTERSIKKILNKVGLSIIDIFPSGKFRGIQREGELESMTIIAKHK
ncbi:MAG: class I SAM-dependent methyltransferase [bacterium]